jgi:YjbE family integral membrane protein
MDGGAAAASLGVILQIVFLDLLLSGDNALVIALACRHLPPEQARRAAWIGAAGAIMLRVALTMMTGELLSLPFVQLLSAFPLLVIALNLMNGHDEEEAPGASGQGEATMLAAIGVIIVSDAAMSLDNVVALAAVSDGNFWLLLFGLALSIPLIVFGSFGFSALMRAFPLLTDLGAGLLGWVAGGMIARDPWIANWIDVQAPALDLVLPLACAIFVLVQGRFARENAAREKAAPPRPRKAPPPRARPAPKPKPEPETNPEPILKEAAFEEAAEPAPALPATPKEAETPKLLAQEVVSAGSQSEDANGTDPVPAVGAEEEGGSDDRVMIIGLVALFLVFGFFLLVFILAPD